ncbi:SIR2 family protein [Azospirillum rugosum]|uniref:SIR2 family protein n=1 Tax=Azospirillum rugosum TaxID=416170 RepID=UPI00361B6935
MQRREFVETYARCLRQGSGSAFLGAGVSMGAGYPSWRDLLRDIAAELKLELDREPDLPGLVQFHLNREGKVRTRLTRIIKEHFPADKPIPEALRVLARLPLRHIWTTNYDTLPERAWAEQRKQLDVKVAQADLNTDDPWAHTILYKMHGSITQADDVVIAKGDYELYRRNRLGFIQLLTGHLISKHMLFLGFSFTDPNVSNLFALMRETFEDHPTEHFTIVKRPQKPVGRGRNVAERFAYDLRRHDLWVEDLRNYCIQTVEVDEYAEITDILAAVETRLGRDSIMVSGSYPDLEGDAAERARVSEIASKLGQMLARRKARIVSGFGLTVGSALISGGLAELYRTDSANLERSFYLRPFPQVIPEGYERQQFYTRYREDLISQAGACIFLSGVKVDPAAEGGLRMADGVLTEFEIAVRLGRVPIPLGVTGGAAAEIWSRVSANYDELAGGMPRHLFDALNAPGITPADLVGAVSHVLEWLDRQDAPMGKSKTASRKTR